MKLGCHSVVHKPLVKERTILRPLHTKFGLMMVSVKAIQHHKPCFQDLKDKLSKISDDMIKESIIVGHQIRQRMTDKDFQLTMGETEPCIQRCMQWIAGISSRGPAQELN